jgi:hypothetical protein
VLHTALAVQQSIGVRLAGVVVIAFVAGLYLWVRDHRHR